MLFKWFLNSDANPHVHDKRLWVKYWEGLIDRVKAGAQGEEGGKEGHEGHCRGKLLSWQSSPMLQDLALLLHSPHLYFQVPRGHESNTCSLTASFLVLPSSTGLAGCSGSISKATGGRSSCPDGHPDGGFYGGIPCCLSGHGNARIFSKEAT